MKEECPLCKLATRAMAENNLAVAGYDGFPVSPGHVLIVPRRHVATMGEATFSERRAIFDLIHEVQGLVKNLQPDGFNIGINDGVAAGQTVQHLHVHVIPRYFGDQEDPRGGIRNIFPKRAKYWEISSE